MSKRLDSGGYDAVQCLQCHKVFTVNRGRVCTPCLDSPLRGYVPSDGKQALSARTMHRKLSANSKRK